MSYSITKLVNENKGSFRPVLPERRYDWIYDPVFTVSSEVDHTRVNVQAYAQYRKLYDFKSMFTSDPWYTLKLDPTGLRPCYSDTRWRGNAEQSKEALQLLAGVNQNVQTCSVTGADYWKYCHRPLLPFDQQFPPDFIFEFSREDFKTTDKEQLPPHRSVGIQTVYRESEAQTDPYSPEYVLQPGTYSELLQMSILSWGHGLPAGLAEVEMIERVRAKRIWEASLPPLHDLSQLDKRRRMMEEMDAKEWAFREGEIQKLQDARLAVLEELLKQRDEAQKDAAYDRLTKIYSKHLRDRDLKLEKTHNDYMRLLRKLEAKRKNVEEKLYRRDIVTDFHKERFPFGNVNKFTSHYFDTYEGLEVLEAGLEGSLKQRKKPRKSIKNMKYTAQRAVELLMEYKAIREEFRKKKVKPPHPPIEKEKTPSPPPTPTVECPPEEDEQMELAVIYLQKLLRGRSTQYEIFKGKENNLELIRELRTVHALQAEEQMLQKADKKHILTLKKDRDHHIDQALHDEAHKARVVGVDLAQLFDLLSKDLIHFQEERRIHAFVLLAERERRRREAEESGRRQVEERRRRERDEIFKHIVQVHQESVDMYLENMIMINVDHVADDQAREEIHRKAIQINDIAYALEESKDSRQSEEIVSELVYSFLIPEIERMNIRKRVHLNQRRHLEAAQRIIQGFDAPKPRETPPETISDADTSSQAEEEMTSQE